MVAPARPAGGPWVSLPRHRPHLDHTDQQAQADEEQHENEQEAGDQVSWKQGKG